MTNIQFAQSSLTVISLVTLLISEKTQQEKVGSEVSRRGSEAGYRCLTLLSIIKFRITNRIFPPCEDRVFLSCLNRQIELMLHLSFNCVNILCECSVLQGLCCSRKGTTVAGKTRSLSKNIQNYNIYLFACFTAALTDFFSHFIFQLSLLQTQVNNLLFL